jgi:uncharacterized protein
LNEIAFDRAESNCSDSNQTVRTAALLQLARAINQEDPTMSASRPSKVFMFNPNDPAMEEAYNLARVTFRYFWREIAWERRRIIPALDLACVKAPFSDEEGDLDPTQVEQMWLGSIDFDGQFVSGNLLNAPNQLKSVKEGDSARFRVREITDWMYAIGGEVYGAHTVNLMRSRMGARERNDHDTAWGLNFGDAKKVRLIPRKKHWFGKAKAELEEHPMSVAMATSLKAEIAKNPSVLRQKDEKGWTVLHHESLAGSAPTVEILLECGADPNAVTNHGATSMRLAKVLGWDKVVALLASKGATT